MAEWKKPLMIGVGWGLGTAVGLAIIVGGVIWYQSRSKPPTPPKPWNALWRWTSDSSRGLRKATKETGLDRKMIRVKSYSAVIAEGFTRVINVLDKIVFALLKPRNFFSNAMLEATIDRHPAQQSTRMSLA